MPSDLLAVLLLGSLAAILGIEAFKQLRRAKTASSWPTTQGRIVSAEVEEGPSMGRFVRTASHRAAITYSYEAAGRTWTSQSVFFGDRAFATGDAARDRVRKYEPNSTVRVFYNPDDPAESVLEPRAAWGQAATRALTWVGLTALTLIAVLVFGRARR